MKFLHTSDLHLGKRVNGYSMMEDQRYILAQILEAVRQESVDGVILAGDIYDKPVPPVEAVQVFDGFLGTLAGMGVSVFLVSGNHDSAERLSFGAGLMKGEKVYISPVYGGEVQKVCQQDAYGKVHIWLLPFLKPSLVRHALGEDGIVSYQEAVAAAIGRMEVDGGQRNVLVAHQFVTGAVRCESEEISVGGIDNVDASVFEAFDYVALGHLHSPQHVGRETVRYCGTPLKYSFSEAGQEKSVTVTEVLEKGTVRIRQIPLKPLRDMRKIRGTYLEVTALSFYQGTDTQDYLQITLTDEEDVPEGMQKLRVIYPNLMRLEYDNRRTREEQSVEGTDPDTDKSETELFADFYQLQNNQPMSEQQRAFVEGTVRRILDREPGKEGGWGSHETE